MTMQGNTDFHFWLTRSVGRTIGLNFSQAIGDGRLDAEEYRNLVYSCQTCPCVESCQRWLAGQRSASRVTRPPTFCRNARKLEALKPH